MRQLPWKVLDGFGGSHRSASRHARPADVPALAVLLARAAEQRMRVVFRGAGRSYGDASLIGGGLAIDIGGLDHVLAWDPVTGVADVEPGVTIRQLWELGIPHGWWPAVVPGTMYPTIAGCVAMNIHGKNCFAQGPFGDHVLELDLLTPRGEVLTLSRSREPERFRAVIAGLGLLGAIVRVRLQLHRVGGGRLKVRPIRCRNLAEMFDVFDRHVADSDYLVGWVDGFAGGDGLGRGIVHRAQYLGEADDPLARETLAVERQHLPAKIMGVPSGLVGRLMAPFTNDPGMRFVNALKYHVPESTGRDGAFLQSHVAFAFLLDYVPEWRMAYGGGGFVQVQPFVPDAAARTVLPEILRRGQAAGTVTYLGVFKRHRADEYLLSHGLDGWSLAMDFPWRGGANAGLLRTVRGIIDLVHESGGRFYAAKDALLTAADFARGYGSRIEAFAAHKRALDPDRVIGGDQARRLLPGLVG
jgi:FAD/FMN-containing dehydrogenase